MATEKLMIDANKAIKFLRETKVKETGAFSRGINKGLNIALSALGNQEITPTVDAVEVVRCKECRWARPQDHREPVDTPAQALICECFMHHHIPAPWGARLAVKPDGFCSCGERRTDG